jgi:hypothetical protein
MNGIPGLGESGSGREGQDQGNEYASTMTWAGTARG